MSALLSKSVYLKVLENSIFTKALLGIALKAVRSPERKSTVIKFMVTAEPGHKAAYAPPPPPRSVAAPG